MTRRQTPEDPLLRAKAEWGAIAPILGSHGEASSRLLAALSDICRPPLHHWFSDRSRKALAAALDSSLRGEIASDSQSVAAYLAGLPHEALHEMITGRPVAPWKAVEYEGSALQSIGGYVALSPPEDYFLPAVAATASAKLLRNLVERERAVEILREVASGITRCDLTKGPGDLIGAAIDQMATLVSGGAGGRNLGDCLESAIAAAAHGAMLRDIGEGSPCSWGIPALDALCPLRPGMLVLLAAPPGAGKTSLALMAAAATAEVGGKGSVALVSLEMSGEELATILAARELRISPSAIRDWTPAAVVNAAEIRNIAAQWRNSEGMTVRDIEAGGQRQTAASISAWMRQRKAVTNNRLALGVIDYLGLLDGEGRQTEQDKLSEATKTLKRAAMSLRIPILCLSQMNREGRKAIRDKAGAVSAQPEPRKEDLRGSGSLEQDADAIVFIHFPDAKTDAPTPRGKIIVDKQRGGATGSIDVVFHRKHQLFVAATPKEENRKMAQSPHESEDVYGHAP